MKEFLASLACLLCLSTAALAQDSTGVWTKTLVGRASGAQAGFSSWVEGGVNTLAATLGLEGSSERAGARWLRKYDVKASVGFVRQDTLEFRKAEDLIRLRSAFRYTAGDGWMALFQPTLAASFRSQFAPGKNFDQDPLDSGRTPPVKVSDLFAPATFTQTLGLSYSPSGWFTQRLGVAAKETLVTIDRLKPLYNIGPDNSLRFELGIEAFSKMEKEIARNVHYKSSLGLFVAFNQAEAPDMIWENLIAMKVNSWLGVNLEWTMIYDADVLKKIQLKEVFSVGISYIFV